MVGLVIPCFRESRRLPRFLPDLLSALGGLSVDVRVLVVDDGSGPEEAAKLGEFVEDQRARHRPGLLLPLLCLPENVGKGGTVRAGWDAIQSQCDWLAFVDADGAVPAAETLRLISMAIGAEGPEMAYFASRPKGKDVERAVLRDLLGAGFRLFTRLMVRLPVRDTQCGLKILPVAAYREIRGGLKRDDFAFDIELAMGLHESGWAIHEVPIQWKEQAGSHVRAVHVFAMAAAVCGFGLRRWFGVGRPGKKSGS